MTPEILLLISVMIVAAPLSALITGLALAKILNCEISEGESKFCYFFGYDIGNILYALKMCGWFLPLTIPIAGLGIFVSIIWFLIKLI